MILGCLAQADLGSVCLAHPQLRLLAESFLYSAIEMTSPRFANPPIPSDVGAILRRPELAAYIRTLSFKRGHPNLWGGGGQTVPKLSVRESDLQEAISFVDKTHLSYSGTWIEELRQGTLDAYLAILISQLPHLQRLHLGPCFSSRST